MTDLDKGWPSLELTDMEALADQISSLIPRALAFKALEQYAEVAELDQDELNSYADALREMDAKKLKQQRKALALVAMMRNSIKEVLASSQAVSQEADLRAPCGSDEVPVSTTIKTEPNETEHDIVVSVESTTIDVHMKEEDDNSPHAVGQGSIDKHEAKALDKLGQPDQITIEGSLEVAVSEVSESGLEWAKSVLGESFEFTNTSADQISRAIYEAAGSPRVYKKEGVVPYDPIERIKDRLKGLTIRQIAEAQGVTPTSVSQWFVGIKSKSAVTLNRTGVSEEPEPTLAVIKQFERALEEEPAHIQLSERYAEIMALDSGEKAALRSMLDPKNNGEMTLAKVKVAEGIRAKIAASEAARDVVETMESVNRVRLNSLLAMGTDCKPADGRQPMQLAGQISQLRRSHSSVDVDAVTNALYEALRKTGEVLRAEMSPKVLQVVEVDGEYRLG